MSSSNQVPTKKSKGRQKVNMVKMSNDSNLQVTFSKRRAGLFKKASELCTLCGVEAAIVVFSPADKAFCFGHPNVQSMIDRFDSRFPHESTHHNTMSQMIIDAHRNSIIRELNLELTQVESLLRAEKRRAEDLGLLRKSGQVQGWFFASLDGFNFEQLRVLKESITNLKKNLDVKKENDMFALANPLPQSGIELGNLGSSRGFDGNINSMFGHNDARLSLGSNVNPYDNYHGTIGLGDKMGLIGGPKVGTMGNGSMDPMISNNTFPSDHYQSASGVITTDFGSSQVFNNMPLDPRLF